MIILLSGEEGVGEVEGGGGGGGGNIVLLYRQNRMEVVAYRFIPERATLVHTGGKIQRNCFFEKKQYLFCAFKISTTQNILQNSKKLSTEN